MDTIALRFSDNFYPGYRTIDEHRKMIEENGFVWYGKPGAVVSKAIRETILKNDHPQILLIHSGRFDRYWAKIKSIQNELPDRALIPEYYRNNAERFNTWFCIADIVPADKNILSKCVVKSSGQALSIASKRSMSPYFIISYDETAN